MNIDNIQDDKKEETEMAKAIRLSGIKVERDWLTWRSAYRRKILCYRTHIHLINS